MQEYDDKDNDDGEHHDGQVDGLNVKVEFHDEVSAGASSAPTFQRLRGGANQIVFSSPPSEQSSSLGFHFIFLLTPRTWIRSIGTDAT